MKKLLVFVLSFAMVLCTVPAFGADGTGTPEAPAIDIKTAVVDAIDDREYTGAEITIPENKLVVKLPAEGGKEPTVLKLGTDYTAEYSANKEVGKATIKLTGIGKYTGTKTVNFKVVKHFTDTDKPEIKVPPQMVGAETLENVSITWNGRTLEKGKHYNIVKFDNSYAGTQQAVFEIIGGYYIGSGQYVVNYNVVDKNLSNSALYLDDLDAVYTYDGTEKKPAVTIKSGGANLVEGKDYILKYENNVNAGRGVIKAVGTGFYAGELTKEFTINPAKMSSTVVTFDQDAYAETGKAIEPKFTVKLGDLVVPETAYTKEFKDNIGKGEATLTLTGVQNGNFSGVQTAKFKIVGKAAGDFDVTLEQTEYAYNGKAHTPKVTVKVGETTLKEDTDYTVTYENNVAVGTASVKIVGKGVYEGTKVVNFRITGTPSKVITGYTNYTKYLTSKEFNLNARITTGEQGVKFKYTALNPDVADVDENGYVTVKDTGVAKIFVETVGTVSSEPASKYVNITVKPTKPVFSLSVPASKQIKVLINKQLKGTTKYVVEYGRNGVYYERTITHKDNEFTRTSTTLTKRTIGKTYYVRVKAVKVMADGTEVEGNWTSRKAIKAK